ncbi:hypothetical protein F5Y10DRAFT_264229 [Nemania abortiva]|nr:hypothetical protein F5Y10DRAFT_264229 [Nemania abortiva]
MATVNMDRATKIRLREELAEQYKDIERQVLPTLFNQGEDPLTWDKRRLYQRFMLSYEDLDRDLRRRAGIELSRAVNLRRRAMQYYKPGTSAARGHWRWIWVIENMSAILRNLPPPNSPPAPPSAPPSPAGSEEEEEELTAPNTTENNTLEIQLDELALGEDDEDDQPWEHTDFDSTLERLEYFRNTLLDLWTAAGDDINQLTVADITTCCLVPVMRREFAKLEQKSPKGYYDKDGRFSREILETAAGNDPNGLAGKLLESADYLSQGTWPDVQSTIASLADDIPPRPGFRPVWRRSLPRRHPLLEWVTDIESENQEKLGRRGKKREHFMHRLDMIFAWKLVEDLRDIPGRRPSLLLKLRNATVRRLGELTIAVRRVGLETPQEELQRQFAAMINTISGMMDFALKHDSVLSLGAISTWIDYTQTQLNGYVCLLLPIQAMVFLYEVSAILWRQEEIPAASALEAFCNRYKNFLYYDSERPADRPEWLTHIRFHAPRLSYELRAQRLEAERNHSIANTWIRFAFANGYDTPRNFGFNMAAGSENWLRAVGELTKQQLQAPSIVPLLYEVNRYFRSLNSQMTEPNDALVALGRVVWEQRRAAVEETLDAFQFNPAWFP